MACKVVHVFISFFFLFKPYSMSVGSLQTFVYRNHFFSLAMASNVSSLSPKAVRRR